MQLTTNEISTYYAVRVPAVAQRGKEWRGPCPLHNGERDSFAVDSETGQAFCHSECGQGWSMLQLEQRLTGSDPRAAAAQISTIVGRAERTKPRIVATYPYVDETGQLLFEAVRYHPKDFRFRRRVGSGELVWNLNGVRSVLYRLPQVLAASNVVLVEGEKDVQTLEQWGFTATCNPGGVKKWKPEYSKFLTGKHVVILPDNDEPGEQHALHVSRALTGAAATVRVVHLPGLPPKGDVTDWKQRGGTREQLQQLLQEESSGNDESMQWVDPADSQQPKFRVHQTGVYAVDRDKKDRWIGPWLEVRGMTRDFYGEGWGVQVQFRNCEGQEKTCILTLSALAGEGKEPIERLLDMGYKPCRDRKSLELIKDYIYHFRTDRYIRCVSRVGWHGGVFVLPDRSIGPTGSEEVLFHSDGPVDHKYRVAGSLTEWQTHVARLCNGNSRLAFAVSAAFAAPLVDGLKADSAGFHFRGLSSTGKTTALLVAGSVWGGSTHNGFLETWRATANGLEARAAAHNHALLCLDEIGEVRDTELGEIVYALGNGAGKSRMTRALTSRATTPFKLVFLSTGERALADIMQAAGKHVKGGQEARLTEIPADAGKHLGMFEDLHEHTSADRFARAVVLGAKSYYGSPIQSFLTKLAEERDAWTGRARELREHFVSRHVPRTSAGEVFRVASAFGLIAAAGEIATELGITTWDRGEATSAADACFLAWVERRGGIGAADVESGIKAIRSFLQVHGPSRFQDLTNRESRVINRAGFREQHDSEWHYFILRPVFDAEICRGYDAREVAKELVRRGWLKVQTGKHLTIKKRIDGEGTLRVFAVLPGIYSEQQEQENANVGTVGTLGTEELCYAE